MVMLAGCVLIPCLMPLLVSTVKSFIETGVETKMTTQLLHISSEQMMIFSEAADAP